jgi:CO dehydrogenase nickel-insertion accessory protein CooC1
VEPGGRSIEAAVSIARMGAELGIKYIAAIANKLTDPQQLAAIQSQMPAIPILAAIEYYSAIQQADLQRKDVFATCPTLADPLGRVKAALKTVVVSGSEGK